MILLIELVPAEAKHILFGEVEHTSLKRNLHLFFVQLLLKYCFECVVLSTDVEVYSG